MRCQYSKIKSQKKKKKAEENYTTCRWVQRNRKHICELRLRVVSNCKHVLNFFFLIKSSNKRKFDRGKKRLRTLFFHRFITLVHTSKMDHALSGRNEFKNNYFYVEELIKFLATFVERMQSLRQSLATIRVPSSF